MGANNFFFPFSTLSRFVVVKLNGSILAYCICHATKVKFFRGVFFFGGVGSVGQKGHVELGSVGQLEGKVGDDGHGLKTRALLSPHPKLSLFFAVFSSCVLSLALLACLIEHLPFSPTFVRVAVCVFFFFSSLSLISLWRVWKRKL